jgi:hypothetical protein
MSDLTLWVRNHYDVLKDFAGPVATTIAAITAIVVNELDKVDSNHVRSLYVKLDEARFFFDKETIKFMQEIAATAERRFELMRQRDLADSENEYVWSKLVDGLTGCDISLRELYAEAPEVFEASLRFDQLTRAGRAVG